MKPTAVRPLVNSQASIPTTGSTALIKPNLLPSSTPSKTIPMTLSHSSPIPASNHVATTNAGNFATVAASHSNSQSIHSTSSKTSCKIEHYSCTMEESSKSYLNHLTCNRNYYYRVQSYFRVSIGQGNWKFYSETGIFLFIVAKSN